MEKYAIEKIIKMLLEKRAEVQEKFEKTRKKFLEDLRTSSEKTMKTHAADCDNSMFCYTYSQRLKNLGKVLDKFDQAIQRAKEGNYGICADCGEQIPIGRLQQIPFAERCVSCKTALEQEQKRSAKNSMGMHFIPAGMKIRKVFSPALA